MGGFIVRAGWPVSAPSHAFFRLLEPNMDIGRQTGRFAPVERGLALSLIGGISVGAIQVINSEAVPQDFAEQAAEILLRGLGIDAGQARDL